MVTDVTEESDHKTLKTNKQTNLKNRRHILNSQHTCPGIRGRYRRGSGTSPSAPLAWSVYIPLGLLQKECSRNSGALKLSFLFCAIIQRSVLSLKCGV